MFFKVFKTSVKFLTNFNTLNLYFIQTFCIFILQLKTTKKESIMKAGKELKSLKQFTRANVDVTRTYMQEKFAELAKEVMAETGVEIKLEGSLSFDANNVTMKFNMFKTDASGKSKERILWDDRCMMLGLKSSDFGKTFTHAGEKYKIVGCKQNRVKKPLIAKSLKTGGEYLFPMSLVKNVK